MNTRRDPKYLQALDKLAGEPDEIKPIEMVPIPAGEFLMGTSNGQVQQLLYKEDWAESWYQKFMFAIEQPMHRLFLPTFEIARYPVTNEEYHRFVWSVGYRVPKGWSGFAYPDEIKDHPVVGVSQVDVLAYIEWLNGQTGMKYRLPTEAEWEKASRGIEARVYPWGDEFNPWRCNTQESGKRGTSQVDTYTPGGDSPFGVTDMAGNVWEWTMSQLKPYPYVPGDGREMLNEKTTYAVRGGAWYYSRALARCAAREGVIPTYTSASLGFRLARSL